MNISVLECGDVMEECLEDESIVVANHQATGDVPLLMCCVQAKREVCNNILWIQDIIFQYTNFGWVSLVHGDFFIQQVMVLNCYRCSVSLKHFFM